MNNLPVKKRQTEDALVMRNYSWLIYDYFIYVVLQIWNIFRQQNSKNLFLALFLNIYYLEHAFKVCFQLKIWLLRHFCRHDFFSVWLHFCQIKDETLKLFLPETKTHSHDMTKVLKKSKTVSFSGSRSGSSCSNLW